jgi:NAD/NADP transhydrogenase beta subunit
MSANQLALWYLVAAVSFILALKGLSHPTTARRGNLLGIIGMAIAVLVTLALVFSHTKNVGYILGGIAIGGIIGAVIARRVQMTQMPELVAAFHSLVGMAAVLIAIAAIHDPAAFSLPVPIPTGQQTRAVHRHVHRRDHVFRLGDRVRQTVGKDSQRAGRLRRSALGELVAGARDDRLRRLVLPVAR